MSRLVAWFAANRVAANLLMLCIVAIGLASAGQLRQETYPNVALDLVSVSVVYPGAPPDEIAEAVCARIEEAIHGIRGIDRSFARATEGYGAVWAQLALGADARRVRAEIEMRVDALDTLPGGAERPVVQELLDDSILLSVLVVGAVDRRTLRSVAERVRDDMSGLPEITRAELAGARPYELAIEVSETALRRHGASFDDVARAVRASSLDLPAGSLKGPDGEMLVRTRARAYRGPDFERIVLQTGPDGTRLLLGDVARVIDGFEESDEHLRFDGRPAIAVRVRTSEPANVLAISRAVRAYVESARLSLPEGVALEIWADQSGAFGERRDLLLRNGAQGLLLILAVLALFLQLRLALWVAAGIPLSFLGALAVLGPADVSINMMSLFAFIVALGLVVDDAILIGENVARHQRETGDGLAGATRGALEVMLPVSVAVLTTIGFAIPTLDLPLATGKVARALGVVVIACLVFSWIEALLILPAHLSHAPRRASRGLFGALDHLQRAVDLRTQRFIDGVYRPLLASALRWPYLTASLALVTLALSLGSVAGGWVRYAFFPPVEYDLVFARVEMPEGAPRAAMEAAASRLEEAARGLGEELAAENAGRPVFEHVLVAIGDAPDRWDDLQDGGDGPHVATVRLGLVPGERRRLTSLEFADRWRERVGGVPGAVALDFVGSDFGIERPIDVTFTGPDLAVVGRAAAALRAYLAPLPGVRDVADSLRVGKRELTLEIRPEAEALGLTRAELARQVRQGFHGEEVQRLQRGRDDVAVVVRYPAEERRTLADLEGVRIRLPGGGEAPFPAVASARVGRGYASIERRDRRSIVNVTAGLDPNVAQARDVMAAVHAEALPRILADHPGVGFALDGGAREEAALSARLYRDWLLALLAAYALLAVTLRSYLQPVLILVAVPFGLVGGVIGHALLGLHFSAFSLIGLVALTGVLINDALVLLDRANRNRAEGLPLAAALVEAGSTRFRAILLTSATTFTGLLPLLFERSAQAAWLKPMAATLGFGVVFATGITLVWVPASCVILEDARRGAAWLAGIARERRTGAQCPTG